MQQAGGLQATFVGEPVEEVPLILEPPVRTAPCAEPLDLELGLRGRVRQALTCPYCHDTVAREGEAVECSRDRCGVLYHAECWEELHECAVLGCCSTRAQPVTSAGYLLKVLRLLVAALLIPRRVAQAIEERENESLAQQIARLSGWAFPSFDAGGQHALPKLATYFMLAVGLAAYTSKHLPVLAVGGIPAPALALVTLPLVVVLGTLLIPGLLTVTGITAFCLTRVVVRNLRGELNALEPGSFKARLK